MPTSHEEKSIARLRKLHPDIHLVYFGTDGRVLVIYRQRTWKRNNIKKRVAVKQVSEFRWTVYRKGRITHASTEGYRSLNRALANASMPSPIPPVPEIGTGIVIRWVKGRITFPNS